MDSEDKSVHNDIGDPSNITSDESTLKKGKNTNQLNNFYTGKPEKRKRGRAPKTDYTAFDTKYANIFWEYKNKSLPFEKCPICKKYFRRMKTHLQKHDIGDHNPSESAFTCKFCKKQFSSLGNLTIHTRIHTGTKLFSCDICDKAFAQSCNLMNHKRIHTGEKPFKCPFCDRGFTQSGNLTNHIRLHTDEKPFKCHFCDRAFTQSGNLSTHVKNNHSEGLN